MKLFIENEQESLIIYDLDSDEDYIQIPIGVIGKTIIINNKTHSHWVEKFLKNVFIDMDFIYTLVEFINEEFPNNSINWFSQFYTIEYYQELLNIETGKNRINEAWSRYQFEKDRNYLELSAAELDTDKIKLDKIKGEVLIKLIEYNLI